MRLRIMSDTLSPSLCLCPSVDPFGCEQERVVVASGRAGLSCRYDGSQAGDARVADGGSARAIGRARGRGGCRGRRARRS